VTDKICCGLARRVPRTATRLFFHRRTH